MYIVHLLLRENINTNWNQMFLRSHHCHRNYWTPMTIKWRKSICLMHILEWSQEYHVLLRVLLQLVCSQCTFFFKSFFCYSSLLTLQYLLLTTQYLKVCYYIATLPHYTTLQHYYITTLLHDYLTTLLHYCITVTSLLRYCITESMPLWFPHVIKLLQSHCLAWLPQ